MQRQRQAPLSPSIEAIAAGAHQRIRLADALIEVTHGVGPSWSQYRVLGATREGLSLAKEGVGSRSGTPSSTKRCLTLSAVRNGTLDVAACKPADVSNLDADGNWVLPGAFYVIRGNGNLNLVGRGAFAPPVIESPVLYPDLLIQVLADRAVVTPEYLRFAWDSDEVRRDIEGRSRTAAGIYKISQGNLLQVRVPVPPLPVQHSQAATLTEQLSVIAKLQRATAKELGETKALPTALLRRTFSGEL